MPKKNNTPAKPALAPEEALFQAVSLCRKAGALTMGFDAVEAVDFVNFSGTQEEKKAQALELKQAAEANGLKISSLAIGAWVVQSSWGGRRLTRSLTMCPPALPRLFFTRPILKVRS